MDSRINEDPFDLFNLKKIKIKDFLIFKKSNNEDTNYIIKEVNNSKAQNLMTLRYIQNLIKSCPDINSEEVFHYLKQQHIFMKRYLKGKNHPSLEK